MLMVEYEYDWRFISSDARRRSLHTCLECHDEPKESLLDFQVDIGIVLISENILHRFAQPAYEAHKRYVYTIALAYTGGNASLTSGALPNIPLTPSHLTSYSL